MITSVVNPLKIEVGIACSEFDISKDFEADKGIYHLIEKKVGLPIVSCHNHFM